MFVQVATKRLSTGSLLCIYLETWLEFGVSILGYVTCLPGERVGAFRGKICDF